MTFVTLDAGDLGGVIQLPWTGSVRVPANGRVSVDQRDVPVALALGMNYVRTQSRFQAIAGTPNAAVAGQIVASTALANGTLTIANQPDVPRMCAVRVDPGTTAITAGNLAFAYVANDGATHTDNISLAAAASTAVTTSFTYGVVLANSAIVTELTGGASPKIQINDTNALALQVDPGFTDFAVIRAEADDTNETIGTVSSSAASITPNTAPNGTHTFGFYYNYSAPDV